MISAKVRVGRMLTIVALIVVCVGFIGVKTAAHARAEAGAKVAADKAFLALYADRYKLGNGTTLDCAVKRANAAGPNVAVIARVPGREPRVLAKGEQCGEYQCQYDWGTGINVCYYDCDWINMVGSIWLHCGCASGGDCRWGW